METTTHPENQYLSILSEIMDSGNDRPNRTGVDTRGVFQRTMRFNLQHGFPAVTTKKLAWYTLVGELLGFLAGFDNAADFRKLGCKIWDANANENEHWLNNKNRKGEDDLGRIYGVQWRDWKTADGISVDQVKNVIKKIKEDPYNRRQIVTAYNPGELNQMALPPCHMFYQFYVSSDGFLDMAMYQRSCDMFLGVPFNIASYALLLNMVAHVTGLKPREFVHILGDAHIYHNHFKQVKEQLQRHPMRQPTLWLNPHITDINQFHRSVLESIDKGKSVKEAIDRVIRLENYIHHPAIKAPMAV